MSTKTTFKRIALVAVAALGFGMLSVAPSSAVSSAPTLSLSKSTQTVLTGSNASTVATFGFTAGAAADTGTLTATLTTKPTDSTKTATDIVVTDGTETNGTAVIAGQTDTLTAAAAGASSVPVTFTFAGDFPGTYVITLTATAVTTAVQTFTVVVPALAYKTGDGAAASPFNTGNGIAGPANTVTLTATSNQIANRRALVTLSGGTFTATGLASQVVPAVSTVDYLVSTPSVGTITANIYNETGASSGIFSSTSAGTVTITVNAAAVSNTVSATLSSAYLNAGTGVAATEDDANVAASRTLATAAATIPVTLVAGVGSVSGTQVTTATITGPGYLTFGGSTGRSLSVTGAAPGNVVVFADGSSGVSTITITSGAFTTAKTVTFYGSVASYTLTAKNKFIAKGVTDTQVFTVKALDSAGVEVPATINVTSSSTATATVSSAVVTSTIGTQANVGVTGVAKGDVTITVANAASSPTVTATYTMSIVTAGIASVALSFDKIEYSAGEKAVITVTAKNADAALVGDATYASLFTATGITSSANLNGYTADASVATTSGVKTYTVYMPLAAGPVTISGTLGASVETAIQATVVTATATVVGDGAAQAAVDAASEATDAANAATDAANAAAEAADAATAAAQDAADAVAALSVQVSEMVNALKKQITALTNLVIKIQKKVKA